MSKKEGGFVLVVTLVFVSLSTLLLSQVSQMLIQNTKLISGLKQLVKLEFQQHNAEQAIDKLIRFQLNWQKLQKIKTDTGIVNSQLSTNFSELPKCSALPNNTWYDLQIAQWDNNYRAYLKVMSDPIAKEASQYIVFIVISCPSSRLSSRQLSTRTTKVYEYSQDGIATAVHTHIQFLSGRML